MKKTLVRITEEELLKIIKEGAMRLVNQVLKEDGGMIGPGSAATNGSGFMNGANNAQTSSNAQYDVPAFGGKVQRKKGYSPKGNEVDMTPALERKNGKGGSISIPKRNK
jgi:hypothetical protein